jgi:hypothetical protein
MTRIVPPVLTSVHPAPTPVRYWMGMARTDLTGGCSIQRATRKQGLVRHQFGGVVVTMLR